MLPLKHFHSLCQLCLEPVTGKCPKGRNWVLFLWILSLFSRQWCGTILSILVSDSFVITNSPPPPNQWLRTGNIYFLLLLMLESVWVDCVCYRALLGSCHSEVYAERTNPFGTCHFPGREKKNQESSMQCLPKLLLGHRLYHISLVKASYCSSPMSVEKYSPIGRDTAGQRPWIIMLK